MRLVKDNKKQEQAWRSGFGVVTKVTSLKYLGSFWGRGQQILQIINLTTLVDVIRVPKACTSGE